MSRIATSIAEPPKLHISQVIEITANGRRQPVLVYEKDLS